MSSVNKTTLEAFLEEGNDIEFDYSSLTLYTDSSVEGLKKPLQNLIHDYREEIEQYIQEASLTSEEIVKYKYNPKRLAYDYYKTPNLYHIILFINEASSIKEFTLENGKVKMIPYTVLKKILSAIIIGEHKCIDWYNKKA